MASEVAKFTSGVHRLLTNDANLWLARGLGVDADLAARRRCRPLFAGVRSRALRVCDYAHRLVQISRSARAVCGFVEIAETGLLLVDLGDLWAGKWKSMADARFDI